MARVEVKNLDGETVKELELVDEVFATPPNQSLLWEATKVYLASQRRGTHSTKSRGEVSGGGKKPWLDPFAAVAARRYGAWPAASLL